MCGTCQTYLDHISSIWATFTERISNNANTYVLHMLWICFLDVQKICISKNKILFCEIRSYFYVLHMLWICFLDVQKICISKNKILFCEIRSYFHVLTYVVDMFFDVQKICISKNMIFFFVK